MQTTNGANAHKFKVTINDAALSFVDPIVQGRQLLSKGGFDPADEHVLIQLLDHETRSVSLDEPVNLRGDGVENFRAFKNDREYRFTLDGKGCEWGSATISEPDLRRICGAGDDKILILARESEPDLDLAPGETVNLSEAGTEHIKTAKRLVTVFFKKDAYKIPRGVYTTEQLMAQFPIEQGYLLNLQQEDGELITLQPGQKIRVKDGMRFFSQVPGGGSS